MFFCESSTSPFYQVVSSPVTWRRLLAEDSRRKRAHKLSALVPQWQRLEDASGRWQRHSSPRLLFSSSLQGVFCKVQAPFFKY
jgi:hypothetical protein